MASWSIFVASKYYALVLSLSPVFGSLDQATRSCQRRLRRRCLWLSVLSPEKHFQAGALPLHLVHAWEASHVCLRLRRHDGCGRRRNGADSDCVGTIWISTGLRFPNRIARTRIRGCELYFSFDVNGFFEFPIGCIRNFDFDFFQKVPRVFATIDQPFFFSWLFGCLSQNAFKAMDYTTTVNGRNPYGNPLVDVSASSP